LVFSQYGAKKSADSNGNHKRQAWDSIDSTILPVMPAFKTAIMGKFNDITDELQADATDYQSSQEKEDSRYQMQADMLVQDTIDQINEETGIPKIDTNEWKPRNMMELDMFEQMGGFRLQCEYAIDKMVDHTFRKVDKWPRIKERLIDSLIDFNKCAVESYTDPVDHLAKSKFVDIRYLVTQFDEIGEYSNMRFYGYFKTTTIDELRKTGEFEEHELKKIATQYLNHSFNRTDIGSYSNLNPVTGKYGYDSFIVDIFVCKWRAWLPKKKVKIKTRSGKVKEIREVPLDYETEKETEEVYSTTNDMLYKCTHVVGTDFIYDHGYDNDIMRAPDKSVVMPLTIVMNSGKSITEKCIPQLRQAQLIWVKYQAATAKMRNKGVAIEFNSVASMNVKGKKAGPTEIVRVFNNSPDRDWETFFRN
jgi:hypothetical protein